MAKGNRSKKDGGAAQSVPGDKNISDDDLQALAFQHKASYEAALATKKKADADFKNVCKRAKAEMGKDAVDQIKTMIECDTPEGEARIKARVLNTVAAARWAGAAFGTQFEMFDGPDRTPAEERAHGEGKRAGMQGDACRPPYDGSVPQYQKWIDGWHKGQEAKAAQLSGRPMARSDFQKILQNMIDLAPIKDAAEALGNKAPKHVEG